MIKKGDLVSHDRCPNIRYGVVYEIDKNNLVWAEWRDTIKEALKVKPFSRTTVNIRYVKPVKNTLKQIMEGVKE